MDAADGLALSMLLNVVLGGVHIARWMCDRIAVYPDYATWKDANRS